VLPGPFVAGYEPNFVTTALFALRVPFLLLLLASIFITSSSSIPGIPATIIIMIILIITTIIIIYYCREECSVARSIRMSGC